MADDKTVTSKDVAARKATPGSEGGQVRQEPLPTSTPRDALIVDGKNEFDYVPDVDRLHVGLVKQPVVPVRDASGNVVGFLAQDDVAKVLKEATEPPTLRDFKEHHNRVESTKEWQAGIRPLSPTPLGEDDSADFNARNASRAEKAESKRSEPKAEATKPEPTPAG